MKYSVKVNSTSWISKVTLIYRFEADFPWDTLHRLQNYSSVHRKWWCLLREALVLDSRRHLGQKKKKIFTSRDRVHSKSLPVLCLPHASPVSHFIQAKNLSSLYIFKGRRQAFYYLFIFREMSFFFNCSTLRQVLRGSCVYLAFIELSDQVRAGLYPG